MLLVEKALQRCWIAGTVLYGIFLSLFVFSFARDDDNTILFYFSWEPSSYRVIKAALC